MTVHPGLPGRPPALPAIPVKGAMPCLERGCSACCHGTEMLLTDADVARIAALRPGLDFWFTAPDGFRQLRTRAEPREPCVFLAPGGLCGIHAARPEGCRLYPAVWDGELRRAGLDAEHCPHTDGFLLAHATRDAARRLAARLEAERAARTGRAGRHGL